MCFVVVVCFMVGFFLVGVVVFMYLGRAVEALGVRMFWRNSICGNEGMGRNWRDQWQWSYCGLFSRNNTYVVYLSTSLLGLDQFAGLNV